MQESEGFLQIHSGDHINHHFIPRPFDNLPSKAVIETKQLLCTTAQGLCTDQPAKRRGRRGISSPSPCAIEPLTWGKAWVNSAAKQPGVVESCQLPGVQAPPSTFHACVVFGMLRPMFFSGSMWQLSKVPLHHAPVLDGARTSDPPGPKSVRGWFVVGDLYVHRL